MLAAVLCVAALGHLVLGENPQVTTSYGTMKGQVLKSRDGRDFFSFTRIPYAKPPVGERRFMISEKADNWTGILDATKPIPSCYQINPWQPGSGQEDCLYLNIFTPKLTGKYPVIFSIHGGAFVAGSASGFKTAKYFMDEDVVFVAPNYRVGTIGFLSFEDKVIPGNFGLKDQALALEWNIVIRPTTAPVLESADGPGAILTSWPTAADHKYPWIIGVCQDEGLLFTGIYEYNRTSKEETDKFINTFNETMTSLLNLENKPKEFVKVWERFFTKGLEPLKAIRNFLTEYMFLNPTLVALNKHAGPTYFYNFNYTGGPQVFAGNDEAKGVGHGAELAYFYESSSEKPDWPKIADIQLSKQLVKMWANFARNQAPSSQGMVQ
ncbi:unnamed protein product [Nezara viridula]|uniref:Carboxylesterase type B domain-containing protein n=1 Tax=Nezara viridula TaxID=85310 RepID=A0A9P0HU44_NEZVI|nr:unnamed protein product [Nezara viridula]